MRVYVDTTLTRFKGKALALGLRERDLVNHGGVNAIIYLVFVIFIKCSIYMMMR